MGWHGGASVGRWGLGWLQPVESDNIAFLLMPSQPEDSRGVATIFPRAGIVKRTSRCYHQIC